MRAERALAAVVVALLAASAAAGQEKRNGMVKPVQSPAPAAASSRTETPRAIQPNRSPGNNLVKQIYVPVTVDPGGRWGGRWGYRAFDHGSRWRPSPRYSTGIGLSYSPSYSWNRYDDPYWTSPRGRHDWYDRDHGSRYGYYPYGHGRYGHSLRYGSPSRWRSGLYWYDSDPWRRPAHGWRAFTYGSGWDPGLSYTYTVPLGTVRSGGVYGDDQDEPVTLGEAWGEAWDDPALREREEAAWRELRAIEEERARRLQETRERLGQRTVASTYDPASVALEAVRLTLAGDYSTAVTRVRRAVAAAPGAFATDALARRVEGDRQLEQDVRYAIHLYRNAPGRSVSDADAKFMMAALNALMGEREAAIGAANAAIKAGDEKASTPLLLDALGEAEPPADR